MSRREIYVDTGRVAGVAIGFVGFDAGAEFGDLAFDLIRNWNPGIASAVSARIPKSRVRRVDGDALEAMTAAFSALHDRDFADCDTIIQHGAFDMLRRSTGTVDKITVMLGVFVRSDQKPAVVVGAGLDMTLMSRAGAAPSSPVSPAPSADEAAARLLRAIPRAEVSKLATLGARVRALALTERSKAIAELDTNNTARRTVWGDQAVTIPVLSSTADGVVYALLSCIADDFTRRQARTVEIEEVAALRTDSLAEQLAAGEAVVRKLVIKVFFDHSFGTHDILRVGDDDYVGMPCTYEPGAASPQPRPHALHVPAPFPHGVAVPPPAPPPAWVERGIESLQKRPLRTVGYGCLALMALSTLMSLILALLAPQRPKAIDESIPLSVPIVTNVEGVNAVSGVLVHRDHVQDTRLTLVLGRFLVPRDFEPSALPVVVVSERLAGKLTGDVSRVLGMRVHLAGQAATVVGIIALRDPANTATDFWMPGK
jgi:hypothetical protein